MRLPGKPYRIAQAGREDTRPARRAVDLEDGGPAVLGESGEKLRRIAFRHTPVENCGGGRRCVPFARWEQAWREMRSG